MKENKLNTNKFLASFWYSYLLCIVQPWLLIISVDIRNNLFSFVFNYSDFAIVYSKHSCWFFLPSSAPVGQYQSSWTGIAWQLCTTMYDYVWLCMTMYEYVWLCMTLYDYVWLRMTMYDYVWLYMTMYDYEWLCMTMYDYVWLCMTLYDYEWLWITMYDNVWLCMTMYN